MRCHIVWTVLRREWIETVRNRLLMSTILIPPLVLTIAPISSRRPSATRRCRPSLPPRSSPSGPSGRPSRRGARRRLRRPAVPRVLPADAGVHPAVDRDVLDHRREAGAHPGAGARRADPDSELLAGKSVAALVPGVLAGWVAYVVFVALASIVYGPALFGVVTDPSWLAGVFLLGPAVGLRRSSPASSSAPGSTTRGSPSRSAA